MTLSCTKAELAALSLSPAEVEALLEVPEKKVRKEIEHGVVRGTSLAPSRVAFDAAVYLWVLNQLAEMEPAVEWRRSFLALVRNTLVHYPASSVPEDLDLGGGVLHLRLKSIVEEVGDRLLSFYRWKEERVTSDPEILGGEPVFRDSRLSVRHVGGMAERGESVDVIREDHAYLSAADVEFARRFSRAYPRVGRPRESAKIPPR